MRDKSSSPLKLFAGGVGGVAIVMLTGSAGMGSVPVDAGLIPVGLPAPKPSLAEMPTVGEGTGFAAVVGTAATTTGWDGATVAAVSFCGLLAQAARLARTNSRAMSFMCLPILRSRTPGGFAQITAQGKSLFDAAIDADRCQDAAAVDARGKEDYPAIGGEAGRFVMLGIGQYLHLAAGKVHGGDVKTAVDAVDEGQRLSI